MLPSAKNFSCLVLKHIFVYSNEMSLIYFLQLQSVTGQQTKGLFGKAPP
jgi:hypothetical protein